VQITYKKSTPKIIEKFLKAVTPYTTEYKNNNNNNNNNNL